MSEVKRKLKRQISEMKRKYPFLQSEKERREEEAFQKALKSAWRWESLTTEEKDDIYNYIVR